MRYGIIILLLFSKSVFSFAQTDTSFIAQIKSLDNINSLKSDTLAVPDDALTRKIKLLRKEKTGLTTETVLKLKLMEEQSKDTTRSKEYSNRLMNEMTAGKTGTLLENSIINLYRHYFTESEIDELIRFYQTSAGKKMDKEFILLMVQSVKDSEQLLKMASGHINNEMKKEGKIK